MSGAAEHLTLRPGSEDRGVRLDKWLADRLPALSRSQISRLIEDGQVSLDGLNAAKAGVKLSGREVISVTLPAAAPVGAQAEAMPLEVLYEDDDVLVIDKAAGIVVHPAPGHQGGTVVNALLARYPGFSDPEQPDRPGIVHRLDRDTSGVLIIAKHGRARRFLQRQFHKRSTEKFYLALVVGQPKSPRGTIEGPIGRHPTHRQKRAVLAEGRPALTHYETVEAFDGFTLLRVHPVTGRTHQIRVHLEAIGVPVAGDEMYGPRRKKIPGLKRHFLHAAQLTVPLPDGDSRTFEAPLPPDLEQILASLRNTA